MPQIFHLMYSCEFVVTDDFFDNQTNRLTFFAGEKSCITLFVNKNFGQIMYNAFCEQKFRQRLAKCFCKNTALLCISNKTAVAFSTK